MDELVNKLKEYIYYNETTGTFKWKYRPDMPASFNNRWVNRPALTSLTTDRSLHGKIEGQNILAHRAAWAIYHGEYRTDIYHHDRNKLNNRIVNLKAYGLPPYGYPAAFVRFIEEHGATQWLVPIR
jgi:hypothetical protein